MNEEANYSKDGARPHEVVFEERSIIKKTLLKIGKSPLSSQQKPKESIIEAKEYINKNKEDNK